MGKSPGDVTTAAGTHVHCGSVGVPGPLRLVSPLTCARVASWAVSWCECLRGHG